MRVEWLLFVLLLGAALVPLWRRARLAAVALVAIAVFGAARWNASLQRNETRLAEQARVLPREGRPGGYVSSDTCQSCHPSQYATWHESYHRTMTQYAGPETVRGDFDNVTIDVAGETYRLERRGDEFWVEMNDPDWKLGQMMARRESPANSRPERVWRRVGLVTGSHHMQTYWVPSRAGNMQLSLGLTFVFEAGRWVPRNDTFLMDPAIPPGVQIWNANCIQCHATGGQPRPEPHNWLRNDTRVGEIGIACEACHGPAGEHVRTHQNPLLRYAEHVDAEPDPTIANPANLDPKASTQVCGQCHGIKAIPPGHPWRFEGFRYRPGEDLEAEIPVLRATAHANEAWYRDLLRREATFVSDRYWSDGMVRVSGREYNGLLETPCYQRGAMSCLSCHSMHQSDPDDQLAAGMESNRACLQCHETLDVAKHTRHQPESSGSLCYNCHMPHTTYGLLKALRSHTIDSPNVETTLRTGRPNACNLCHLDQTLQWTADHLRDWYQQDVPLLSSDEQALPASALWALQGDAGQRALLAWHMGWEPARRASGDDWLAPYLAQLLEDRYSTVRYIAHRSLQRLPGFADFAYDFIAPESERALAHARARTTWEQTAPADRAPVLVPDAATWKRLLDQRDDKSMNLLE